jgi:hypothetical protein
MSSVRFLIDADPPRSTKALLEKFGHEAIDVRDIGLRSAKDPVIARYAQDHHACLLTGDFGFADIRNYPPESYYGIVVLARIIHECFYCNRRYAATTSLTAGGLAARSVNILFKDASLPRGSARPSRLASQRFRHEPS